MNTFSCSSVLVALCVLIGSIESRSCKESTTDFSTYITISQYDPGQLTYARYGSRGLTALSYEMRNSLGIEAFSCQYVYQVLLNNDNPNAGNVNFRVCCDDSGGVYTEPEWLSYQQGAEQHGAIDTVADEDEKNGDNESLDPEDTPDDQTEGLSAAVGIHQVDPFKNKHNSWEYKSKMGFTSILAIIVVITVGISLCFLDCYTRGTMMFAPKPKVFIDSTMTIKDSAIDISS